jgi:hypothetical protein
MSATRPGEDLNASAVIALIESGAYPRDTVVTIARGFLPLAQHDLIAVFSYLAMSADTEIAGYAETSLQDVPSRVQAEFAANESLPADHLVRLMCVSPDPLVLEALIRNKAVPDEQVAELARHAEPRVQEVIVINHARILRAPHILEALEQNPAITNDVRRRVHEARDEFFVKQKARDEAAALIEKSPRSWTSARSDSGPPRARRAGRRGDSADRAHRVRKDRRARIGHLDAPRLHDRRRESAPRVPRRPHDPHAPRARPQQARLRVGHAQSTHQRAGDRGHRRNAQRR